MKNQWTTAGHLTTSHPSPKPTSPKQRQTNTKTSTRATSPTTSSTSDHAERHAYLALALVPGLGARRLAALRSHFPSIAEILAAPRAELARVARVPQGIADAVHRASVEDVPAVLARAAKLGQQVLTPGDAAFPPALRSIPDPPIALWVRGNLECIERPAVAIVGSRDHSSYGEEVARDVATAAARSGIVVVSGMARGLDAIAHEAALDAGGTTVGVLGNGADVPYPRGNRRLYERVVERGLLLTEHPPGEEARAGHFPRRNRLISGLSRAIVVVEAALGSGTMITVTAALEQGREVLVVPGPITSPTSRGTNRLLREGATPLLEISDLLSIFGAPPVPVTAGPADPAALYPLPHRGTGVVVELCGAADRRFGPHRRAPDWRTPRDVARLGDRWARPVAPRGSLPPA